MTIFHSIQQVFSRYKILALLIAIALIWAFFTWQSDGAFLTARNFANLLRQMAIATGGTYTFLTDAVKKDNFKVEDGKKAGAQQLCANAETKKYLDAGYSFNFNYKFKDGSNLEVPFKAGDC